MSDTQKDRKRTIKLNGVVFFLDKHGTPKGAGLLTTREVYELLVALHEREAEHENRRNNCAGACDICKHG